MELYSNTKSSYFEYFYAVMLECSRCNFEMFRILLYTMCSNVEVMSFCKDSIDKKAFIHTNPLNFTPSKLQKENMPEYSE